MIIAFVGTPGSGKTYEAVQKILENIKLGRKVYTNIDGLDLPQCKQAIMHYCNITDFQFETLINHLDESQVISFWDHCEQGSLIVLDEVHKYFSNREWQSEKNVTFTKWASTHRHQGFDLVLVTQDAEKVDKHCRSLIEWTYVYRKLNQFGSFLEKKYVIYAYAGDQTTKLLTKSIRTYDKRIFPCYSSYVAADVKELKIMKGVNMLKHPIIYAIPIVFTLFIYTFLQSGFADGNIIPGSGSVQSILENNVVRDDVRNDGNVVRNDVRNDGNVVRQENSDQGAAPFPETPYEKQRRIVSAGDPPGLVVVEWVRVSDGKLYYTNNWIHPDGFRFKRRI